MVDVEDDDDDDDMELCRRPSLALARGVCIHTVCGSQSKMAACHRLSSEAGFDACVSQVLRKFSEEEEEEEQWCATAHTAGVSARPME